MSRSIKKSIIKDKGWHNNDYWKIVRSTQNQIVREIIKYENIYDAPDIPHHKSIINDYDYCDWKIDYHFKEYKLVYWNGESIDYIDDHDHEQKIKYSRK